MMVASTPAHATGRLSPPLSFLARSPMVRHFSLVWTPGKGTAYAVSWWCAIELTDHHGGKYPQCYEKHAQEVVDTLNRLYALQAPSA